MGGMDKKQIFWLVLVVFFTFLIVYVPHVTNKFPVHVDEWHHITESIRLGSGDYPKLSIGFELGFHVFLMLLGFMFNLVNVYRFLPAIWAIFSSLMLFYVVQKKSGKYSLGLFSMLFFASIRSNVNITGIWFFTPLSFSIPFIFLYVYLFTSGIESKNKKLIIYSLIVMLVVLIAHPISIFFSIGFLFVFCLLHYKYVLDEWKFFSWFLVIPIIGLVFYFIMTGKGFVHLLQALRFDYGWGVLELKNSFLELYSLIGYVFALVGIVCILLLNKKSIKKYLIYLLWPLFVLCSIIFFRIFGFSYFVPYQRNLYYFVLGLPILSAFGLYFVWDYLVKKFDKRMVWKIVRVVFLVLVVYLTFRTYFYIDDNVSLYRVIDDDYYDSFMFMKGLDSGRVIATPEVSTALFPMTGHWPVATIVFYGDKSVTEKFFAAKCDEREEIISKYDVDYVLFKHELGCSWDLIYDKDVKIWDVK